MIQFLKYHKTDLAWIALAFGLISLVVLPAGFTTGFLTWKPAPPLVAILCLIVLFITPGLSEELTFRYLLFPKTKQLRRPVY
ncbi:MAG: hypothetical protein OHK0017_01390 [Patescibacteria group bacterium]